MTGLFLALVVPVAIDVFHGWPGQVSERFVLFSLACDWLLAVSLCALVVYWEKLTLASIGFARLRLEDVGLGFGGFVIGVLVFPTVKPLVEILGLGSSAVSINKLSDLPVTVAVLSAVTAGVTEEVLFRGYAIERLGALCGNVKAGAVLAYVVFVGLHAQFWGAGGTLQIAAWSLIVTALYLWKRRLAPCMIMHLLNDLFALVAVPMLAPTQAGASG